MKLSKAARIILVGAP
ncbi:hypothetical protein V493_08055, partial [Pseudogymnoascus sp. VKM F-4281 (FW-2241)]